MTESALDDFDTLLEQVERKYMNEGGKPLPSKHKTKTPAKDCPCNAKTETNWDEVEELLRDFRFEDTNPFGKQNKSWVKPEVKEDDGEKREIKCFPVYLAGSYEEMGLSEVGFEKPCDRLKCLRCDFDVEHFDNYAWDASTDYLFLRNNMPDFEKLEKKLNKKKGSRAYACQCANVSVTKLTNINSLPSQRWICKKHVDRSLDKLQPTTKYTQRY